MLRHVETVAIYFTNTYWAKCKWDYTIQYSILYTDAVQYTIYMFMLQAQVGCPNFASKKVSFQSETKRNANGFAWLRFLFAKLWEKIFASFRFVSLQKFRFVSLKNMFRFKVLLREQFCFKIFASFR